MRLIRDEDFILNLDLDTTCLRLGSKSIHYNIYNDKKIMDAERVNMRLFSIIRDKIVKTRKPIREPFTFEVL